MSISLNSVSDMNQYPTIQAKNNYASNPTITSSFETYLKGVVAEKSSIEVNIIAAEKSVETSGRAEEEGILKTMSSCYECPNREKCLHHTGGGDDIQTMYPGYSNDRLSS